MVKEMVNEINKVKAKGIIRERKKMDKSINK